MRPVKGGMRGRRTIPSYHMTARQLLLLLLRHDYSASYTGHEFYIRSSHLEAELAARAIDPQRSVSRAY